MQIMYRESKRHFIVHVLICILAAAIQVGVAFIYQLLTETAISGDLNLLIKVGIFSVAYLILDACFDFFPRKTKSVLNQNIMLKFRSRLVNKLENLSEYDSKYIDKNKIVNMLVNESTVMETEYFNPLAGLILSFFVLVFSVLYALNLQNSFSIIMLLLSFFPLLSPYISKKILSNKKKKAISRQSKYNGLFEEFVLHLLTLKINRSFPFYRKKFNTYNQNLKEKKIDFETAQGMTYAVSYGLGNIVYSGTWIIGSFFVIKQRMTLPQLIAMTTLMSTIAGPLQYLSESFTDLAANRKIVESLWNFTRIKEIPKDNVKETINTIKVIELNQVDYFKNSVPVIKNFSYRFMVGKKYVVIGESGTGKSTLLNLIMGIDSPTAGTVKMDDIQLDNVDKDMLYQKMAYMKQDTDIFSASIAENVSFFHPYDINLVEDVLNRSNLSYLVSERGINTEINSSTNTLSGGEKKRLDIARALFKNADVLIFDEPTSGLDRKNERIFADLLKTLEDKMIIVVTHSHDKDFLNLFDEKIYLNREIT
ncbi:ATP-binding cassette domain-containing protein [Amphibacillus sp. Q70]|uniref:ATP-binding cassette domain-containing protein n=1 Tax=Amphibacillus sp. Q70 TaxID=3453416 RepID=UPI003F86C5D7